MKKSILIILSIIFVATSCHKVIDLDVSDAEKKIVINGILYPDSIVRVNISRSLGVLEEDSTEFQFLNKATAKLYENDNYIETLVFDSLGFYHSTIIPDLTKKYKLEVESEGIEKAVGRIELVNPIEFAISDMEYSVEEITETITMDYENFEDDFESFDTTFIQVYFNCKFNIPDPADQENYYAIVAYSYSADIGELIAFTYDENNEEVIYDGFFMEESEMQAVHAHYYIENNYTFIENSSFYDNGFQILKDNLFSGQNLSLNMNISFRTFDLQPIYMKMYSIPKDYIDYIKSEEKYWQAHENPYTQPVNVFSNIENGFGIFTAFGLHEQIITLN